MSQDSSLGDAVSKRGLTASNPASRVRRSDVTVLADTAAGAGLAANG